VKKHTRVILAEPEIVVGEHPVLTSTLITQLSEMMTEGVSSIRWKIQEKLESYDEEAQTC
jgi:hypothetical protein